MIRLERLGDRNLHLHPRAMSLYESAFPREERRDEDEQNRVLSKEEYHFDMILDGEELLGIMLYWKTEDFIFLEHFAVLPEARGRGVGATALELLKAEGNTVILEIEVPSDEITRRRLAFYRRCGFVLTKHYHIQAKYRLGDDDLVLKILSYPHGIDGDEYRRFYDYMCREIGVQG